VPGFGISIVKAAVLAGTQLHVVVVRCDLGGVHGPDAIAHSRQHRYLVPSGDGVLWKAVQAERQPYSGALLQHLEAQPVGRNELGLHIRHPAYRPDPAIPRRRHRPADQWRSERRRDPCTFRLGCHAPLCLTADAERPPLEEIMSIGGARGARRGTGPTYLDCPLSRGALYLFLQNRISRGPDRRK
jgi:hypothetical protein